MKFIYLFAVVFAIYLFTTDSGKDIYQSLRAFVVSPIDKAKTAANDMDDRHNNLTAELDEIVGE